jgi:hypothetical protein
VQIRTQDLLSDDVIDIVADALRAHRASIERGVVVSIDEGGRASGCSLCAARRRPRSHHRHMSPLSRKAHRPHAIGDGPRVTARRRHQGRRSRRRAPLAPPSARCRSSAPSGADTSRHRRAVDCDTCR